MAVYNEGYAGGALLHCYISEIRAKNLSRNGDMGADRADSFDAPQLPKEQKHYKLSLDGTTAYIVVEDQELRLPALVEGTSYTISLKSGVRR